MISDILDQPVNIGDKVLVLHYNKFYLDMPLLVTKVTSSRIYYTTGTKNRDGTLDMYYCGPMKCINVTKLLAVKNIPLGQIQTALPEHFI